MRRFRFVLAMAGREGRASWRRLVLLMAAISVGVGGLVATHSFTANLRDSVRAQARALLGADLIAYGTSPFSPKAESLLDDLRRSGGGKDGPAATSRVTALGAMAYVPRTTGTRLVQVSAVEGGYPFYGEINTDPPGLWKSLEREDVALVDPSLLVALGARRGDTLALGEARLRIAGTVVNVPGDVGLRAALGPRVFMSARSLPRTRLLGFGARARYEAYLKLPPGTDAERLASRFRRALAEERVTLRTVSEDERSLSDSLDTLGRYLALVALMALLLGGLGVASAVHVFVQRKIETVAVLRCLGATSGQVLAIYLMQAAAMGLLGSLAGAALGAALQLALPKALAGLLPVDVRFSLRMGALLAGVLTGLWVATLFALLPLLALRRVSPLVVLRRDYEPRPRPPRERWLAALALAGSVVLLSIAEAGSVARGLGFAGGVGAALGALWLCALLLVKGMRRFFPRRWPYVWRQGLANLFRPANQTVTVVLALGFGAFLLATLFLVQRNLLRELRPGGGSDRPNLVLFDIQPDQRAGVKAELDRAGLIATAPVPIVPMRIRSVKGVPVSQVVGAAPEEGTPSSRRWAFRREYRSTHRDTLVASERVVAGEAWPPPSYPRGAVEEGRPVPISLEEDLAAELGVKVGDEIVWDVQGVAVPSRVASLRAVHWTRFEPNFFVVFPDGPLDAAPQTFVVLTRIDDGGQRARFQRQIVEPFPNVSAVDLAQVQQTIDDILHRVSLAIRFMALLSLATGAVILVGAVASTRYQRVREVVLLKTLGARRGQILRIAAAEYLCLGAPAVAAALLLSSAAGWALVRFVFEERFTVPVGPFAVLGLAILALTVVVGLWNSLEVLTRTPLEVLRAE